jgi:hypothetical protein
LTELLGGAVNVESEVGKGSIFIVPLRCQGTERIRNDFKERVFSPDSIKASSAGVAGEAGLQLTPYSRVVTLVSGLNRDDERAA